MKRLLSSSLIPGLAMAGLLGTLVAAAPAINAADHAPRSVFLQLPETTPEPEIAMRAEALPGGKWRLSIASEGFIFTEVCVSEAAAIPVGHAHIVVNGVKVASAYAPVVDIDALPAGKHRIKAVLRGQDHRALLGAEGLITAEVVVEVAPVVVAGMR